MRPLGQFPDWADHATSIVSVPTVGFTPGTQDPSLANWSIRQGVRDWSTYLDAIEGMNWGPSNVVPIHNTASGVDCFSYDPIRRLWFFGGIHVVDNSIGQLSWSADRGVSWSQISNTVLPFRHGSDTLAYYQQAVADDGRYFTWLHSATAFPGADYAYFNLNAGFAGWVASTNKPAGLILHAFWAQADNRFLVCGVDGTGHGVVWSVDVDTDTWDVLTVPGSGLIPAIFFGASSPSDRIVATGSQMWRTSTVASAFAPVTVPWANMTGLVYLPGSRTFVAIADGRLWSAPNGVVWSQVVTGFEATGTFGGAVSGLGDIVVATFRVTNPDGVTTDLMLVGTNALRTWQAYQSPQANVAGTYPTFAIYPAGDCMVALNNEANCATRRSMNV